MPLLFKAPEVSDSSTSAVPCNWTNDAIKIDVFGSTISVCRKTTLDVPGEVTAVIPRAEFRKRNYEDGLLVSEEEIILNSITVVHAPRHPLHEEGGSRNSKKNSGKMKGWVPRWLSRILKRKAN